MAQELNLVERRIPFLTDLIFAHLCQLSDYVQINKMWTKWEHLRCIDKFLVCGAKGNDQLNQMTSSVSSVVQTLCTHSRPTIP